MSAERGPLRPENAARSCLIPRCKRAGEVWIGRDGYVCEYHADNVWRRVEQRDTEGCDRFIPGAEARDYERADGRARRAVSKRKPSATGEIYFVRVDDLVKVGWTTKLADRVRAYGPKAELLAHYPGTRADETALHQQLAPARFRGREWYSDTDIIRAFVAETVATHGPPRFDRIPWSEPKGSNIRPKRTR